jgi:hypothetical protein
VETGDEKSCVTVPLRRFSNSPFSGVIPHIEFIWDILMWFQEQYVIHIEPGYDHGLMVMAMIMVMILVMIMIMIIVPVMIMTMVMGMIIVFLSILSGKKWYHQGEFLVLALRCEKPQVHLAGIFCTSGFPDCAAEGRVD